MPGGKPGDHPVTDVVIHRSEAFGQPVDALIRVLDQRGLWASAIAREWLYERYWDYREIQQRSDQAQVARLLDHVEARLNEEAHRLGVE